MELVSVTDVLLESKRIATPVVFGLTSGGTLELTITAVGHDWCVGEPQSSGYSAAVVRTSAISWIGGPSYEAVRNEPTKLPPLAVSLMEMRRQRREVRVFTLGYSFRGIVGDVGADWLSVTLTDARIIRVPFGALTWIQICG